MEKPKKIYNNLYIRVKKINEGSFGKIIFCQVTNIPGEYCVLKKFKLSKQQEHIDLSQIRELTFMQKLDHPNVLKSSDVFKTRKSYNGKDWFEQVYMHLPFFLEMSQIPREKLSAQALKVLVKQLLEAVVYLRSKRILHRDIKPSNIFLDENGTLLLGDLGIARDYPEKHGQELTGNTTTRLYRPPEILLGSKHYDETADLWSLGCTIAEFAMEGKKYFFEGKSEIDQLCKVFEVRGAANETNWPGCTELPFFMDFGDLAPQELKKYLPNAPTELVQIVDSLLQLCPSKRAKPEDILQNEWIKSANEEGLAELKAFAKKQLAENVQKIIQPKEDI